MKQLEDIYEVILRFTGDISNGKDAYIFNLTTNTYEVDEDDNDYYVPQCTDMTELHKQLFVALSDDEEVHIVLDYYYDDDNTITRIYGFISK